MINVVNTNKAYSEVYSFLNTLGEKYISKVPKKIYSVIEEFRDKTYNPQYSINQEVTTNTFSKEALALIVALNLQYFCKDEKEKEELKTTYLKNTEIERERESERYNPDNIFIKKVENIKLEKDDILVAETQLVEYKQPKWYHKLFKKILSIFKK